MGMTGVLVGCGWKIDQHKKILPQISRSAKFGEGPTTATYELVPYPSLGLGFVGFRGLLGLLDPNPASFSYNGWV